MATTSTHASAITPLRTARASIADRLRDERALPPHTWDVDYQEGLKYAVAMIDNVIAIEEREPLPVINADVLGRAIAEHRQAEFEPHQHVLTHLCFDDCAEDIYARCLRLIAQ